MSGRETRLRLQAGLTRTRAATWAVTLIQRFRSALSPLDELIGHSITCRIAVGPRVGQKLFPLQRVPLRLQGLQGDSNGAARAGVFSLRAGLDIAPQQREKPERLCRYASRPPVASERLALGAPTTVLAAVREPGTFDLLTLGHTGLDLSRRCKN